MGRCHIYNQQKYSGCIFVKIVWFCLAFLHPIFCPLAKIHVLLTILDVFLPVSGCKNTSVGCIYGSNSLYACIIGRGVYTLTNIHPDVFLPVVKMPCTHYTASITTIFICAFLAEYIFCIQTLCDIF